MATLENGDLSPCHMSRVLYTEINGRTPPNPFTAPE